MENFRFYFNRHRFYVSVYLHEVSPATFERKGGGRWAYYLPEADRGREGKLGELHFVAERVRIDVVSHELIHVLADVLRVKRMAFTDRNEERIASLFDELTRSFWRAYKNN